MRPRWFSDFTNIGLQQPGVTDRRPEAEMKETVWRPVRQCTKLRCIQTLGGSGAGAEPVTGPLLHHSPTISSIQIQTLAISVKENI